MKRIDHSTATVDLEFTEGNPGTGTPATRVTAQWLNVLQEEIANVVEEAGLTLDQTGVNREQLYDAINILIDGAGGDISKTLFKTIIAGYTLSNNGSDANNDIDIQPGACVDSAETDFIILTSAITKRLDANFAAGTNQGGLDNGTKANSTTYHVHAIYNPTTGAEDVLFSTSLSSPMMPSGFTKRRRIGSIITDASGNIHGFVQTGNEFRWKTPAMDVNTTFGTTAALYTLRVPTGFKVGAIALIAIDAGTKNGISLWTDPDLNQTAQPTSVIPSSVPIGNLSVTGGSTADGMMSADIRVNTDTSGRIRGVSGQNSTQLRISTAGYIDERRD